MGNLKKLTIEKYHVLSSHFAQIILVLGKFVKRRVVEGCLRKRVGLESESKVSRWPKVHAVSGCWGLKSTKVKILLKF